MDTHQKSCIREIAQYVNKNAKSHAVENIQSIEEIIATFSEVDKVILYKHNQYKQTLAFCHDAQYQVFPLEDSFLKKALIDTNIIFDNHVITNKNFNASIDNPDSCPIRGMMLVPIVAHKKTIAIVSLFRSARRGKNFTRQEAKHLEVLIPLLVCLMDSEPFPKQELLDIVGTEDVLIEEEKTAEKSTHKEIKKPSAKVIEKKVEKKSPRVQKPIAPKEDHRHKKLLEEIALLKSDIENEQANKTSLEETIKIKEAQQLNLEEALAKEKEAQSNLEEKLEKAKESLEDVKKEGDNSLIILKEELSLLKEENEQLKALEMTITEQEASQSDLEKKLKVLQKENIQFHLLKNKFTRLLEENKKLIVDLKQAEKDEEILSDLKNKCVKAEQENITLHTRENELKEQLIEKDKNIQKFKNIQLKDKIREGKYAKKYEDLEDNLEFLLKIISSDFKEYRNAYILFELLVYALVSRKGMDVIETHLIDSKIVYDMMEEFYNTNNTKIQYEKYELSKLFDTLSIYENEVFNNTMKLKIELDGSLPKTLVLDTPKTQSILCHLLGDLYGFANHKYPIYLSVYYDNKILQLTLSASIEEENSEGSLLKNMFGKSKINDNDKGRLGLASAKKLVQVLNGNLETHYQEKYYEYIVRIPAKVLDLKFV